MSATECDIRVGAICGSLRPRSYTRAALEISLEAVRRTGAATQLIDLRNFSLPFATGGDQPDTAEVVRLREQVRACDGIILGTPEYHGSLSGVLKNTLDLMGFEEFEGKMIGLVGVSGGRMGAFDALTTLRNIGRALHAWVLPDQASIPEAWNAFNAAGELNSAEQTERVRKVGTEVAKFARLHKRAAAHEFMKLWETTAENPGGEGR
jgi:FMN reductase